MTGWYQAGQPVELPISSYFYMPAGSSHYVEVKADGTKQCWRKSKDGRWRKIPAWVDPAALHYFPWRPSIRHSCDSLKSGITL